MKFTALPHHLVIVLALGVAIHLLGQQAQLPLNLVPATTAQEEVPNSKVDYESFMQLTQEVFHYRKDRLVDIDRFLEMAKDSNTVILDTRSKEMYDQKHLKGAIHLNFSDFSPTSLQRVLGRNTDKRILIYCNNNFKNDERFFFSKIAPPTNPWEKPVSLALNIPTFINLYGYGYKNVYELSSLLNVFDPRITFEQTAAPSLEKYKHLTTIKGSDLAQRFQSF